MVHLTEIEKRRLLLLNNKLQVCKIYIREYKTLWKITIKPINHEYPICIDWTYKKSKYKKLDSAIEQCITDTLLMKL